MTDAQLAAIQARSDKVWPNMLTGLEYTEWASKTHDDREALLAEVRLLRGGASDLSPIILP